MPPYSRTEFILPGFDEQTQKNAPVQFYTGFAAVWLRKTYTDERSVPSRPDDPHMSSIKFGNNITVLFRACNHLRDFYGSFHFWPALALRLNAKADEVQKMIDLFARARRIYCEDNPVSYRIRTLATIEVDNWQNFLRERRGGNAHDVKDTNKRAPTSEAVQAEVNAFFSRAAEQPEEDSGGVLGVARHLNRPRDSLPYSRKRSSSPDASRPPRSPKRLQSYGHNDRTDSVPTRSFHPTPSTMALQVKGSASKQEYQTPTSAFGPAAYDYRAYKPSDASKIWTKVSCQKDNASSLPASDMPDGSSSSASASPNKFGDQETIRIIDARIEKKLSGLCDANSPLNNRELVGKLMEKMAELMKSTESFSRELELVKAENTALQARLSKVEGSAALQAQTTLAKVAEVAELVTPAASVSKELKLMKIENTSLQNRLFKVENLTLPVSQSQTTPTSVGSRVDSNKCKEGEASQVADRVTCIAAQPSTPTTPGGQSSVRELWSYVHRLEHKLTRVEAQPEKGELREELRKLELKAATTENRVDKLVKELASKVFVEERCKQLENRQARDSEATAKHIHVQRLTEQIKNLQDKDTAMEIQVSGLSSKVNLLNAAKVPCSSENNTSWENEMLKRLNSLPPAMKSAEDATKRISQIEQNLGAKLEDVRKELDLKLNQSDIVAKSYTKAELEPLRKRIASLPTTATVQASMSERGFQIEKNVRAEHERYQRDINGFVEEAKKDQETMRIQIKELNKLWNEATAGIAKTDSVIELRSEYAAVSKKFQELSTTVTTLETLVTDMSVKVHNATLPEVTSADLKALARLQEFESKIDGLQSAVGGLDLETVKADIRREHERVNGLQVITQALIDHYGQPRTYTT